MPWLEPATPEEMAVPGWEVRRNAEWNRRRDEWRARMVEAGFSVKLKRLGRGKHPPPGAIDLEPGE